MGFVYFPTGKCVVSRIVADGNEVNIANIGREGAISLTALFGASVPRHEACILTAGSAWRIEVRSLRGLLTTCPVFAQRLITYLIATHSQIWRQVELVDGRVSPQPNAISFGYGGRFRLRINSSERRFNLRPSDN